MKKKSKHGLIGEVNDIVIEAIFKIQETIEKHMNRVDRASLLDFLIPLLISAIGISGDMLDERHEGQSKQLYVRLIELIQCEYEVNKTQPNSLIDNEEALDWAQIKIEDREMALTFLVEKLVGSLGQHMLELPKSLQGKEMILSSIEILLTKMLVNLFNDPESMFEQLSEHVRFSLQYFENSEYSKTLH